MSTIDDIVRMLAREEAEDVLAEHIAQYHSGTTPPPDPEEPPPVEPPPAGSPCTAPDWKYCDGGKCVRLGGRTYNTRFTEGVEDRGDFFRVRFHNATGTYLGNNPRQGTVSFEAWYETAPESLHGKHYHEIMGALADRSTPAMRDAITHTPMGRIEVARLFANPRILAMQMTDGQGNMRNDAVDQTSLGESPILGVWIPWQFNWDYDPGDGAFQYRVYRGDHDRTYEVRGNFIPGSQFANYFLVLGHVEDGNGWCRFKNVSITLA